MLELPVIEDCGDCTACCLTHQWPPYVKTVILNPDLNNSGTRAEAAKWLRSLPDDLVNELAEDVIGEVINNEHSGRVGCLWLNEDGMCKHYEHRPEPCRNFEVGGDWCRASRRDLGIEKFPMEE